MSKIINLKIKNFRGIKLFEECFDSSFICMIGRGDSCKSTILEAIHSVLSPVWNLSFDDTDFFKCDPNNTIEIEITLSDLPEELLRENKYGLFLRKFYEGKISDDVSINDGDDVLTIKLSVDKSLEPKWIVRNYRNNDETEISAKDREKLNCFLLSEYSDRHFSFGRGNLLYSLVKEHGTSINDDFVVNALRQAKEEIDKNGFESLNHILTEIAEIASDLGVNVKDSKASIDSSDIVFKNSRISVQDSESIPYRLKGNGTRRLLSMAIQLSLLESGGILLIDEVEQGLEPDRIRHIANLLKDKASNGQVIMITHSRDAILELSSSDLFLTKKSKECVVSLTKLPSSDNMQNIVRACPEAFFAKKLIICEGKTEIGICRSIERYCEKKLGKESFSFYDVSTFWGNGSSLFNRAIQIYDLHAFNKLSVFLDSDISSGEKMKEDIRKKHIEIFECDSTLKIEDQVFKDLPQSAIIELIDLAVGKRLISAEHIKTYFNRHSIHFDKTNFSVMARKCLSELSTQKEKPWFKRIDHGEMLGDVILNHYEELEGTKIRSIIDGIINFVYGD